MYKSRLLFLGVILVIIAITLALLLENKRNSVPVVQACTKELKVCPDGSTVGRTEPNCAFAACPAVEEAESEMVAIGEVVQKNNVQITPLDVVSDSRCARDVTCIWAGTVTLETKLENNGTSTVVELMLNEPHSFGDSLVTLVSVLPLTQSGKEIQPQEYRFDFSVDTVEEKGI